jgi:ribosomal protein S18 acetylase RimI-like enzyme
LQGHDYYYYVYFLGTRKDGRGQGLCSAIVRRYQEIAKADGFPIYIEAGSKYACGLYKSLGFEIVKAMISGAGEAGPDGLLKKDGEGFKIWSMIWRL